MTYYQVEFQAEVARQREPKRFRTEEKAKKHARKVLGIAGRAAVAAREHFPFVEQGVDHYLAGLLDVRCKYVHRLLLGVDTGLKKLANSGLHVHLCDLK